MTRAAALAALHDEIRAHDGCGFEICAAATHLVPGEGDPDAALMLVGEAPGAREDELGRPFVGRSGELLDLLLAAAGLARPDVFITNVVKARPPANRDPRPAEVAHHMPWLERQLELVRPALVVTLGRHALAHFAPGVRVTVVHGAPLAVGGRTLVPWFHPAAALRSTATRAALLQDARALPGILEAARR
jgi:uracil-DNA glycosylase family 4